MAILTPAPANFQQKIRSELTEVLQLSYADIIPTVINMRVTMGASGVRPAAVLTETQQSDLFRIPGDYTLLVSEVRADVTMNQLSQESTVGATGLNALVGARNRTIVKALNAKVSLVNADRNNLTFVENNLQNSSVNGPLISDLCLASLMPVAGGAPLKLIDQGYITPIIFPGNERIRMTVTLRDPNAALGQTEYGLALMGALVRSRVG